MTAETTQAEELEGWKAAEGWLSAHTPSLEGDIWPTSGFHGIFCGCTWDHSEVDGGDGGEMLEKGGIGRGSGGAGGRNVTC